MNENIDLTKILKDCPRDWKLYSSIHGEVQFRYIDNGDFPIVVELSDSSDVDFTKDGKLYSNYDGECALLPSKDQRDWSKFTAPWCKKGKFDPKTLQAFDKVLVKISNEYFNTWYADFVAEPAHIKNETPLILGAKEANMVIPYNEDTKHLVGTTDEAPEYYRYWED